jgi:hypothetical protein
MARTTLGACHRSRRKHQTIREKVIRTDHDPRGGIERGPQGPGIKPETGARDAGASGLP